jgi:hypothetical protein
MEKRGKKKPRMNTNKQKYFEKQEGKNVGIS